MIKSRLNQKGFTLIELLAVVGILLLISVVAIFSIGTAIDRSNEKKDFAVKKLLVSYTLRYASEYKNTYNGCANILDLQGIYNITDDMIKASNGKLFNGSIRYDNKSRGYWFSAYDCSYSVPPDMEEEIDDVIIPEPDDDEYDTGSSWGPGGSDSYETGSSGSSGSYETGSSDSYETESSGSSGGSSSYETITWPEVDLSPPEYCDEEVEDCG